MSDSSSSVIHYLAVALCAQIFQEIHLEDFGHHCDVMAVLNESIKKNRSFPWEHFWFKVTSMKIATERCLTDNRFLF